MPTAHQHGGGSESLLAQHAGHLGLLLAWMVIFAIVVARQKLPALRLAVHPLRPSPSTVAVAATLVLAGGANWVAIGQHTTSTIGQLALIALTVTQLLVAGLVASRPSDLLVRGVATACLAIGLWSVLAHTMTGSTAALSMVEILAFSAQLATAGCGWLVLSGTGIAVAKRS